MEKKTKSLVITGGHHISALATAFGLKKSGWTIVWFGHRHSMWGDKTDSAEYKEVRAAGIKFYDLKAGKLYNTYHPLKLLQIPFGFFQAIYLLLVTRPMGIVSFGGYLAVPTVVAGWMLGIPSITHEQTVIAGWANKFITPFVKKIAVSWPSSLTYYPSYKTVLTGLPVRSHLTTKKSSKIEKNLIYVTGGKQGSHAINMVIFSALPELTTKYKIIHQTGQSTLHPDYQKAIFLTTRYPNYQVFDFDSSKAVNALQRSSVVVGRSGAHTIYELALLSKPCVLIPIPQASHSEQQKNAQVLVDNHQAVLLPQDQLSPRTLLASIDRASSLIPITLDIPMLALEKLVDLINQTFIK